MFADICRLKQELESTCSSSTHLSSMLHPAHVNSLAADAEPSSTSNPNESERDRYLASLGYTRYDDPYMLATS